MIEYRISWKAYLINQKISSWNDKVKKNVSRATEAAGLLVQSYAKTNIQKGTRSGRFYKRPNGKLHQASVAGEWPKSDSGHLVSQIYLNFDKFLTAKVGTDVVYGRPLELGDPSRNFGARPFLKRSLEENKDKIAALFNAAISQGLK